jgi:hypothetical protein
MGVFDTYYNERIQEADDKIERQKQYIRSYQANAALLKNDPEYFECRIDSGTYILVYAHKLEKLGEYLEITGSVLYKDHMRDGVKSYLKLYMGNMQDIQPLTEEEYKSRLFYYMTRLWRQ